MVSLKKKRFQDERWNLDLACTPCSYLDLIHYLSQLLIFEDITDRIIAMGFPSSGMEKYFRNSMEDTQAFLNYYHPTAHKVRTFHIFYSRN